MVSHSSERIVCKGSSLEEHYRHRGKGCKLYFVPRVESLSIFPTTLTNSGLYGDLLYFCNVHWLSRGEMLQRVYILREKHKCYRILQSRMGL